MGSPRQQLTNAETVTMSVTIPSSKGTHPPGSFDLMDTLGKLASAVDSQRNNLERQVQRTWTKVASHVAPHCRSLPGHLNSIKADADNLIRSLDRHHAAAAGRVRAAVHRRGKRSSEGSQKLLYISAAEGAAVARSEQGLGSVAGSVAGTVAGEGHEEEIRHPSAQQFLKHPLAVFSYVPKDAAFFFAGAVAGGLAKTLTAPLDRWKLMLQVRGVQNPAAAKASVNLLESFLEIGRQEGVLGYWRGNLPQVIRIIPYSAVQLFAYETYKNLFTGGSGELTVPARLAAGACAGMTSTFITYPLDVLRLRLAVDPSSRHLGVVVANMIRDEGPKAFYKGLGPSLLSIAPYIALNFCTFDLIKKSIPEKWRKTPQASFVTAICATTFATVMCYPLDTVRRQMQMKGSPFNSIFEAVPGIIARDGIGGLYRGFIANALKNLPNSSIRLTTYDAVKTLLASSKVEFQQLVEERKLLAQQKH